MAATIRFMAVKALPNKDNTMAWLVGECVCSICGSRFVAVLPVDENQEWEPPMECFECGNMTAHFIRVEVNDG